MPLISWQPQNQIKGAGTSVVPQLAFYQNKVIAAWKGVGSDHRGWFSVRDDKTPWAPQGVIPGIVTANFISLTVYNNLLYAFWATLDGKVQFTTFDGSNWSKQHPSTVPGLEPGYGVSAATFDNQIFIAYRGSLASNDDACHWRTSSDLRNWSNQVQLAGGGSVLGPSLGVLNNKQLFAAWQGVQGDDSIYYSIYENRAWGPQGKIPGGTSSIPALAPSNSQMVAIWKGVHNDTNIYYSVFAGTQWTAGNPPIAGSGTAWGVGACNYYGFDLIAAWQGDPGDDSIWWTQGIID